MKVTFCLPTHNFKSPIGGFKIVYEYSNYLVQNNVDVNIVFCTEHSLEKYKLPLRVRRFISKFIVMLSPRWFKLDRRVNKIAAPRLEDKYIPNADIVFATAVKTSTQVSKLSESKGKKFYLIQDFENWEVEDSVVFDSYKLGMRNIVVSSWLYDIVKKYSDDVKCIKNPIDLHIYKVINPIGNRNPLCIGMLYHDGWYKGTEYSIATLKNIKNIYPELKVIAFGNPSRPKDLPEWFEYYQHASSELVAQIYNKCSIFICSSIVEGFGLTGLESMACGCALVSSNYKGVFEYAVDRYNSLISQVKDVKAMEKNIVFLIENKSERIRIANNAVESVKDYSWENAVQVLLSYFKECEGVER